MANQVTNVLSLLALKVKQNVFDISSSQYNISIRDQVARGSLLARDLCKAHQDMDCILIVGAGIAGVAAAERALLESKKVKIHIVEKADRAFSLQRGKTTRFVGPFMYEWPAAVHGDQSYPPTDTMTWGSSWPTALKWSSKTPISADQLCKSLDLWLTDILAKFPGRIFLHFGVDGGKTIASVKKFTQQIEKAHERYVKTGALVRACKFRIHYSDGSEFDPAPQVNYVILACGPGQERVELANGIEGLPFWSNDTLRSARMASKRVGIFGGGDGALQDVLRALTGHKHPLVTMKRLLSDPNAKRAIETAYSSLLTAENQARLLQNWTTDPSVDARLDKACQAVAHKLAKQAVVRKQLATCIRSLKAGQNGRVIHVVKGDGFDRAYMLNRFLVHLIDQAQAHPKWPSGKLHYALLFHTQAKHAFKFKSRYFTILETNTPVGPKSRFVPVHLVVVRYGVQPGTVASAMKTVDEQDSLFS